MRRCARCGEEKSTSEFGWKNKAKTRLMSYCRPCVAANSREHYAANKTSYLARIGRNNKRLRDERTQFLLDYFVDHPCVDCGETDPVVLDFDHLRDKEFSIGHELASQPWERVLAEIDKCDVVCANCHRRRTAARDGSLRAALASLR
jgi:hypothetical protein